MDHEPRVSVVMPVFNGGPYLDESLRSLEQQTLSSWELIAVDDGSTDDTWNILNTWSERDPRVRPVRHRDRRGIAEALNTAMKHVRGRLIARLDADDLAAPSRFALQVQRFDSDRDLVLCGGAATVVDATGSRIGVIRPPHRDRALRRAFARDNPFVHSTTMFRRSAYLAAGGYMVGSLHEDYELWVAMARIGTVANLPDVLCDYRRHSASLSAQNDLAQNRRERLRLQMRAARDFNAWWPGLYSIPRTWFALTFFRAAP